MASEFGDIIANEESQSFYLLYALLISPPLILLAFGLLSFFEFFNFSLDISALTLAAWAIMLACASLFARHSSFIAYAVFVRDIDKFKQALKNYIVSNLVEFYGVKKSNASFSNFVYSYISVLRDTALAKSFNLAIFLLCAMSLLVYFGVLVFDESFDMLDSLLQILKNCIYILFYALFLAFWWLVSERLGLSRFDSFIARQEKLSGELFWRDNEFSQNVIARMLEHFDDIKLMLQAMSKQEFFTQLDGVIKSKFEVLKGFERTQQDMINQAKIGIEQNIKLLDKTALRQGEFIKIHTEILKGVSRLNESVSELELKFLTHYNRLSDILHNKSESLEKSIEKFHSSLALLDRSLKDFSLELNSEQNANLQAFRASLLEGVEAFRRAYDEEITKDIENSSMQTLEQLRKDVGELESEASQAIANLKDEQASKS